MQIVEGILAGIAIASIAFWGKSDVAIFIMLYVIWLNMTRERK